MDTEGFRRETDVAIQAVGAGAGLVRSRWHDLERALMLPG